MRICFKCHTLDNVTHKSCDLKYDIYYCIQVTMTWSLCDFYFHRNRIFIAAVLFVEYQKYARAYYTISR